MEIVMDGDENLVRPARGQTSTTGVEFMTMTELRLREELVSMMRALCSEDEAASPVDQSRF